MHLSQLFLPNPGFTLTQSDPAGINFDFNNQNRGDNLVAKSDFVINPHHILTARFIYANTNQTEEDTVPLRPDWLSTTSPITQVFGVSLASTFGPHGRMKFASVTTVSTNPFSQPITMSTRLHTASIQASPIRGCSDFHVSVRAPILTIWAAIPVGR